MNASRPGIRYRVPDDETVVRERHDPGPEPVVAIFRSPLFNASETFVRTHVTSLERFRPLLVGLEDKGNVPASWRENMILPRSPLQRLRLKLRGPTAAFVQRVRAHNPVLLHAHFGPDGLIALPLAKSLGIPLVTTLHGYEVSRSHRSLLTSGRLSWMHYALHERRLMDGGDLFVAVSDALRRRAIDRGYPSERTIMIHNGINLSQFTATKAFPQEGLILHVGRLVPKKGTKLLIHAFAQVRERHREARLVIIGDGPLRAGLERLAAERGIGDAVTFLGQRSQEEVASWMRRAWLLAAPSLTACDGDAEGLPTAIVEAAAAGLPVVASDHSGAPEAVDDGASGFVVPEGDAAALTRRLLDLIGSERLRASMSAASRAIAETRFDASRQTRILERHYDRLCWPAVRNRDGAGMWVPRQ